jgi:hypothetical protein
MEGSLTATSAIIAVVVASFMWGTWPISLKHLRSYPLDAFFLDLYIVSLILIIGLNVPRAAETTEEIAGQLAAEPTVVVLTVISGGLYVAGIRAWLYLIGRVGLALANPIFSSVTIVAGTLLAAAIGGLRPGTDLSVIVVGSGVLIGAVVVCVWAGHVRDVSLEVPLERRVPLWQVVAAPVLAALLVTTYPVALSAGLTGPDRVGGMTVLPFMLLLASGSLVTAVASAGVGLRANHGWRRWRTAHPTLHLFGLGAAMAHYGGNIMHAEAALVLSVAIAWPISQTVALWGYLWGLAYGEFRGATVKAYLLLLGGGALFGLGVAIVASAR